MSEESLLVSLHIHNEMRIVYILIRKKLTYLGGTYLNFRPINQLYITDHKKIKLC